VRLVLHQVRYDLRTFWRDPAALFFTAMLPVIFLVVFVGIFGNQDDPVRHIKLSTYYVPGILALAVISATFVNLAITLTTLREDGVLKRLRGTPLPAGVFVAGRVLTSFVLAGILVVVLALIGRLGYGVALPGRTFPAFVLTLLVGTAAFCCLGIAVTRVIPTEKAGPAVTNAIVLPLYFISGTFFPVDDAPGWMRAVARVFPIRHFGQALLTTFAPAPGAATVEWGDLAVVAAWGLLGLLVALRTFRWTPTGR
jgi:ABC-2 type transport system permease protein